MALNRAARSRPAVLDQRPGTVEQDRSAAAADVTLRAASVPRTVGLDERRLIDCDQEGRVLGVECRNVGAGISLERVPDGDELATVIAELAPNLRTLLPPNASSAG